MKDPKPPAKKGKINDFFKKVEKETPIEEDEEENQEQSTSCDVQKLRCPKRKVLDENDETDDILVAKKEKRTVRKRSSGSTMKKLGKSQMVLDCGQSLIGNTTCKDCGMVYCVDDAEDVKSHEKFHTSWRFRFEFSRSFVNTFMTFPNRDVGPYKVYFLATFATEAFKKLVTDYMKIINLELGYINQDDLWTDDKRLFLVLCVRENRMLIGGIAIIEKITQAFTNVTRQEVNSNEDINDWIVGVDRIWVDPYCRKKGVAYSLLDAATTQDRSMEYRSRRLRIAFSDPTDDGLKLAQRFTESRYLEEARFGGEILVY